MIFIILDRYRYIDTHLSEKLRLFITEIFKSVSNSIMALKNEFSQAKKNMIND